MKRGGGGARIVDRHRGRERKLSDADLARARVVAEEDPVPGAGAKRPAGVEDDRPGAVAQRGGQRAGLVDLKGEARSGDGIDTRHQTLPAGEIGQGRPDGGGHREAVQRIEGRGGGNACPGTVVDRLHPRRVATGKGGLDGLLAYAGAGRVGVAADDAHQARLVVLRRGRGHLERDGFAGRYRIAVGIAGDRKHFVSPRCRASAPTAGTSSDDGKRLRQTETVLKNRDLRPPAGPVGMLMY